jgi:hypothetical protein
VFGTVILQAIVHARMHQRITGVVSPTLVEAAAGCVVDINAVQRLEDPSPWPSERRKSELRMAEAS